MTSMANRQKVDGVVQSPAAAISGRMPPAFDGFPVRQVGDGREGETVLR